MSKKKRLALILLPVLVLLVVLALALFNILVDPYGVFGDPVYDWYGFNETMSPGLAKVGWLEEHPGEYDTFILGSEQAAAYDPERLDAYTGGRAYNLFSYTADAADYRDTVRYLTETYDVKRIVLSLGIEDFLSIGTGEEDLRTITHPKVSGRSLLALRLRLAFGATKSSLRKLDLVSQDGELARDFDLFLPETGTFDRRALDTEVIGDAAAYAAAHAADFAGPSVLGELTHIDEVVECVRQIRRMCDDAGAQFTVILAPEYISRIRGVSPYSMRRLRTALAEAADFWDFTLTPVSYDSRYFYNTDLFRDAAGDMILGRIFSDPDAYCPEDFGALVTRDTCDSHVKSLYAVEAAPEETYTKTVPVLLFHHLIDEPGDESYSSRRGFENQLKILRDLGYTTVSLRQLEDYVLKGTALPEKPVLLTFDDGYASNYEIAFPILEKYGMKAVIFPIGVSIGETGFKTNYKDTSNVMTPHFGFDAAREMEATGLIEIGSHTWDMHQWPPFETGDRVRENILPFEGESEADYAAVLRADLAAYTQALSRELDVESIPALAYPSGQYTGLTEALVMEAGVPITFASTDYRTNVLVQGLPGSLRVLARWPIADNVSPSGLMELLASLGS